MAITIAAIGAIAPQIAQIFIKEPPTPEEQKQKAGTWYVMLQDFVRDPQQNTLTFGARWKTKIPFVQTGTKERFIRDHIQNKSPEYIINTLVDKINDELTPDFPPVAKDTLLNQMGVTYTGKAAETKPVNAGTVDLGGQGSLSVLPSTPMKAEVKESNNVFYGIGVLVLLAGIFAFIFSTPKKRRR